MGSLWNNNEHTGRPFSSKRSFFRLVWMALFTLLLFMLLVPSVGRGPMRRSIASQRIRQIAKAMASYESIYHVYPPAYTVDASGNKLHSWRTLILPYLDQADLYSKIDLSKPWDAPQNATAHAIAVVAYEPDGIKLLPGQTLYHVINHPQGMFDGPRQTSRPLHTTQPILMVVQVAKTQATHWMQPDEYTLQDLLQINDTNASGILGRTNVVFSDLSERQIDIQENTPEQNTQLVTK